MYTYLIPHVSVREPDQVISVAAVAVCGKKKIVEVPGFEPGALRMRSACDTTTPHPRRC